MIDCLRIISIDVDGPQISVCDRLEQSVVVASGAIAVFISEVSIASRVSRVKAESARYLVVKCEP